jgi:serine/threonine protein kinase
VLQARIRVLLERKRLRDRELSYLRRVARLTVAAEEVEGAMYTSGSLADLAREDDALGRLARVFDRVASGWQAREARLKRRVRQFQEEIRRIKPRPGFELELLPGFDAIVAGQTFANRFELIEELGRGGMGVVYRARDRELGDEIAIKVMRAELLKTDAGLVDRLKMEIRLARRITHPNVVRSHDFGEWEGSYFLTMEYIAGTTVERLLETHGRLSVASTLAIGAQLADALVVAHEQRIIHRDIKPANLLVDDDGLVKVTDFGLARTVEDYQRITEHGSIVGTPHYMAPEQIFGNAVDERSDLYSAGAVLYECLTGAPPYDADTATEIVARMVDAPPVPVISILPDVNPAISALVAQLLSFEAKDRPQTARELVERLRELS